MIRAWREDLSGQVFGRFTAVHEALDKHPVEIALRKRT